MTRALHNLESYGSFINKNLSPVMALRKPEKYEIHITVHHAPVMKRRKPERGGAAVNRGPAPVIPKAESRRETAGGVPAPAAPKREQTGKPITGGHAQAAPKQEQTGKAVTGGRAQAAAGKVRYPIGFKLMMINSLLLLASLGGISALVSVLVSRDVQMTAEENNFTTNQRASAEAERALSTVRSNALLLLDTLDVAGPASVLSRQASAYFFARNEDIAAIMLDTGAGFQAIINNVFFLSNELDPSLVTVFLDQEREAVEKCRLGEELLINAAPMFQLPLLVMFCPRQEDGDGGMGAAVIFFSSESLNDSFSRGVNASFMINDAGDIMLHPEPDLVRTGANMARDPLVEILRESSGQSLQTLYADQNGKRYFGAFQKLAIANAAVITNVGYDVVFEGTVATTRRNLYLAAAVLFASVLAIWFFSKSISRPLKSLTAAAGKIAAGEFDLDLPRRAGDEIGVLTDSFSQMSNALGIFGRFTNREIALQAMRGEIHPGGVAKNATIFFSDIRDFTAIGEDFTRIFGSSASGKFVAWLNEYLTGMVDCVKKTGGVVDKYIGDSIMAHWGTAYTSGSPARDALNCVYTALLMRNRLVQRNRTRKAGDLRNPRIRIGCAINSGMVTAGQIGSQERMEYTVIGDPVNLASRVEALNKPLGTDILITEDTWSLIKEHIIVEEMPPVWVKGKEKSVRLFAVVNMKTKKGGKQAFPATLAEVRKLLGIKAPDLSTVDVNEAERKYRIGSSK
jgi:adenylate cyclase